MRLSEYDISSSGPLKTLWIPPGSLHSFLVRMCGYRLLPSHPQDLPPEDHPFPQYKDRSIFLLQMRPVCQTPLPGSAHTLRILQSLHFPVHSTSFLLCCSLRRWLRSHVLFRRFRLLKLSWQSPLLLCDHSSSVFYRYFSIGDQIDRFRQNLPFCLLHHPALQNLRSIIRLCFYCFL